MKRQSLYASAILAAAFSAGCGPPESVLKPGGDIVQVTTRKDVQLTGELLAVRESTIVIYRDNDPDGLSWTSKGRVVAINSVDVKKIEVQGYADRSWLKYVLIFEGIPTLILTGVAASVEGADAAAMFIAGMTLTGLNWLIFELSTPSPPGVEQPLVAETLYDLRKFARFPQDFTPSQMDSILATFGQSAPWELRSPAEPAGQEMKYPGGTNPRYVLVVDRLLEETVSSITIAWQGKTLMLPKSQITIEHRGGKYQITVPARLLE